MNKLWYVLQSKPNKEEFLTGQLEARNIEYFFPKIRVKPVNPRSHKYKPYFNGYIFFHSNMNESDFVNYERIPGVQKIVHLGGEVAYVPESIVQAIRNKVDSINNRKSDPTDEWLRGEVIDVQSGPFEGYEAIFDESISGTQRVIVLLNMLQGRKLKVELPVRFIGKKKPSLSIR
jgi:transcription antitermination factor NusG